MSTDNMGTMSSDRYFLCFMLQTIREAKCGERAPMQTMGRLEKLYRKMEEHTPVALGNFTSLLNALDMEYARQSAYRPDDPPDSPEFQRIAALAAQTWLDCEAILTSQGIDECTCREELGAGPLSPLHFEVIFGPPDPEED